MGGRRSGSSSRSPHRTHFRGYRTEELDRYPQRGSSIGTTIRVSLTVVEGLRSRLSCAFSDADHQRRTPRSGSVETPTTLYIHGTHKRTSISTNICGECHRRGTSSHRATDSSHGPALAVPIETNLSRGRRRNRNECRRQQERTKTDTFCLTLHNLESNSLHMATCHSVRIKKYHTGSTIRRGRSLGPRRTLCFPCACRRLPVLQRSRTIRLVGLERWAGDRGARASGEPREPLDGARVRRLSSSGARFGHDRDRDPGRVDAAGRFEASPSHACPVSMVDDRPWPPMALTLDCRAQCA